MRLMSLFAPFSAKPSALHRLFASGAGAAIVLVSAIGPAAAVEEPDITRTVEAIVHNITVDEPGDTDDELEISTVVEVDGELYDLSEVAVPPLETGDVVELGVRSAPDVPLAEAMEAVAEGELDEAAVVSVEPDASALDVDATLTLEGIGSNTLVMLPVYWSTGPDVTAAALRTLAQSTADYWVEQSGGRVTFSSSDARDWVQVGAPPSCTSPAMLALYSAAVAAHGVASPTDSRHVVVYFPHSSACGWAGMASIGGGMVWVNGPPSRTRSSRGSRRQRAGCP